ncbi:adenine phosphoribosyltransferase [Aplysia californica]|uniref:Adenine phosphoribosyltransferase n=1 Tax=Aplysia californica TaxID=6500 RepID=A0ABM0JGK8_APLCA|nr:adenine phosphoribosyltransferase [Aplysia californica]
MADDKLSRVRDAVGAHEGFPKPGIVFRDIFPVLRNPSVFNDLNDLIYEAAKAVPGVECIVGLDSRGFLFGPILALKLNVPFVPVRKKGKLPGAVERVSYTLEYGSDEFEVQKDSVSKGQKVLIIDDLLATGGTMKAACQLMEKLEADVVLCLVIIELTDLGGRKKLTAPFKTLLEYEGE